MRSWPSPSTRCGKRRTLHSNAAFSLIELMVAVTILSVLMLLAIPTYQRIQRRAKAAAIANDLRVYATIFQTHAHEKGSWPKEVGPGVVPPEMSAQELKFDDWTHTTPIGGKYDWEYEQTHAGFKYRAAIAITGATIDADLFTAIDQAVDDGNFSTGNFFQGNGNFPVFIIEK